MSDYSFLVPSYENAPILFSQNEKGVRRRTVGSSARIAFFSQELEPGNKLVLRVEQVSLISRNRGTSDDCSFVFGVSTCTPSAVSRQESHATTICRSTSPCGGMSITFNVFFCDKVGFFAYFDRLPGSFVNVIVGHRSYMMQDLGGIFDNRKAYPFIMLTGAVGAVKIIHESEIPDMPSPYHYQNTLNKPRPTGRSKIWAQNSQQRDSSAHRRRSGAPAGSGREWFSSVSDDADRDEEQERRSFDPVDQPLSPQRRESSSPSRSVIQYGREELLRQLQAMTLTPAPIPDKAKKWTSSETVSFEKVSSWRLTILLFSLFCLCLKGKEQ